MKRGMDAEKTMGPMFPRLHVNDTEKGGPRAPPRNKMALYEQLSIPSQRFSHGMSTLNSNNTASVVPPALSIHGSGHERGMFFPLRLPSSTRSAEKSYDGYSDSNTSLAQLEQKKKLDEDDFMVPTLVQSEKGRDYRKHFNGTNGKTISPSSPAYLGHSVHVQSTSEKGPKRTNITGSNLGQEGKSQNKENAQEQVAFGASSHHDIRAGSELHNRKCRNDVSNQPGRGVENGLSSILRRDSCSYNLVTDGGFGENKTHGSLPSENVDKGDDASETSMVDSIACLDISPDDVVGIIGQKHFWKARKAIANQQRVFAVQVFELHRLMKVQKSIAGSPHLLIEDNACSGQPLQGSLPKKLSLEYGVKPSPRIVKHKDGFKNPNPIMECSAENAFGNTSLSRVQNVSDPNCRTLTGNPLSAPVLADNKLNPCFNQLPGHQWLIPVMSPSEGLIYKPYPGHGFMGPGCGPQGTNPMIGNFIHPAYGVQASHHHYQEIGVPRAHPGGHGYFPPFGMPLVHPAMSGLSVEQANNFAELGSHGQLSGDEATFTTQNQSSRIVPTQKKGVIASKGSELQGSTASSPAERGTGVDHIPEGRNALSLFLTSPSSNIPEEATQLHDTEQPPRVIKVVPHHARSATESAARIFQSIQEGRKSTTSSSLAYAKQSLGG